MQTEQRTTKLISKYIIREDIITAICLWPKLVWWY